MLNQIDEKDQSKDITHIEDKTNIPLNKPSNNIFESNEELKNYYEATEVTEPKENNIPIFQREGIKKQCILLEEPKFFMRVLNNIKKEKGLNIYNTYEYIINGLINMHFEKKRVSTTKIELFRKEWNLDRVPATEAIFVNFMEVFPEFNFFE